MFEIASRRKYRFQSSKGLLQVEQLWELPLTTLDEIAKSLHRELHDTEPSFIEVKAADEDLQKKFEIVKYIIQTRQAEIKQRENANEVARQRQHLEALREKKIAERDGEMTLEEIEKKLAGLN